jgi:hypothetical protein
VANGIAIIVSGVSMNKECVYVVTGYYRYSGHCVVGVGDSKEEANKLSDLALETGDFKFTDIEVFRLNTMKDLDGD